MTQDNLAELRQEYKDFSAAIVPDIKEFDNTNVGGVYSNLLNRGDSSGVCARHQHWIVKTLLANTSVIYSNLASEGIEMIITSGYRCPAGNRRAVGTRKWYPNSQHTKGRAFDWDQGTSAANWQVGKYIYDNMDFFNATDVIIYNQNEKEIHNSDIPEEYDQRPEIILKGTTITAVSVYTHGHVTF